jgi:hypothetical protein
VTQSWADALDAFEARVVLAETVAELGGDGEAPAAFEAPASLEPFPAHLADRARGLLARAETAERRLSAEQERLRNDLARLPRSAGFSHSVSRFDTQV